MCSKCLTQLNHLKDLNLLKLRNLDCHFLCTPHNPCPTPVVKALSATRGLAPGGLAPGGLGTRQSKGSRVWGHLVHSALRPSPKKTTCPFPYRFSGRSRSFLEDRNLLKLRSLDSSCPFFLSDNSIWGQCTQMLQML